MLTNLIPPQNFIHTNHPYIFHSSGDTVNPCISWQNTLAKVSRVLREIICEHVPFSPEMYYKHLQDPNQSVPNTK
jgi:hypothetical protein